jgi:hypothetical protein
LIGQRILPLDDGVLLSQLEELAGKLEIKIRHENLNVEDSSSTGGLCRINNEYVLIVHSRLTMKEKIRVMIGALKGFDLSEIYVRPMIRGLLENNDTQ